MHMRLTVLALVWLAVFTPVACSRKPSSEEFRQSWSDRLRDGYGRTNFEHIFVSVPSAGMITGFRMWQGEYRGVPIALYSCSHSKPWGGDFGWISIVLAVEETGIPGPGVYSNYSGPPIPRLVVREIAEHKYTPQEIEISSILANPKRPRTWNIGELRVEVKDQGAGRLGFRINATRKPSWSAFDLEQLLKGENLSGPKKIEPMTFKKYIPEEFAKAMISILKTVGVASEQWWLASPSWSQAIALDHPMWENPSAVKELLTTAAPKELVYAIHFMGRRCIDSMYLRRLESIDSTLLGLANHKSARVRRAIGYLICSSSVWPKDVHALEPLLKSDDPEVQSPVLRAFANRGELPRDMQRVKELAKSKNEQVRFEVDHMFTKKTMEDREDR